MANSFWQREKGMKKMNSTLLFSRFRKPENFGKLLAQRRRISSKRFRACKRLIDRKSVV